MTTGGRDRLQLDVVEETVVVLQTAEIVATALAELGAVRVDRVDARALQNGIAARVKHQIAVLLAHGEPLLAVELELIWRAYVAHQVVQVLLA